jgi:hypothetical protein
MTRTIAFDLGMSRFFRVESPSFFEGVFGMTEVALSRKSQHVRP